MGSDDVSDDDWQVVKSKKSTKKEKQQIQQQRAEQWRKNRDIRYLQTHSGFQKHRITRDKALKLLEDNPIDGSLFIVSNGRCVGHLIAVNSTRQFCLQCKWVAKDGVSSHCCCSEDVIASIPPNFYLGCDGYLNDFLTTMREDPLLTF